MEMIEGLHDTASAERVMREVYDAFVRSPGPGRRTPRLLTARPPARRPSSSTARPARDRTGWAAALLLEVAGVDRGRSSTTTCSPTWSRRPRAKYLALVAEHLGTRKVAVCEPTMVVEPACLDRHDAVAADHGTVDGYLRDGLGLGDDVLERLRSGSGREPGTVRDPQVGLVVAVLVVALRDVAVLRAPPRRAVLRHRQATSRGATPTSRRSPRSGRARRPARPSGLVVLRLPAVLAMVGVVLLTVQAARLLGAARAGRVLTAVVVGFSAIVLGLGHMLATQASTYSSGRRSSWSSRRRSPTTGRGCGCWRAWSRASASTTNAVAFCLLGVLVGVALVRETRPVLRTRWPWLSGLVALALWVPNLVWQAQHDWPVFAFTSDIADEYGGVGGRGPGAHRDHHVQPAHRGRVDPRPGPAPPPPRVGVSLRPLAIAFLVVTGVFLVTGGKAITSPARSPPWSPRAARTWHGAGRRERSPWPARCWWPRRRWPTRGRPRPAGRHLLPARDGWT